MARHIMTVCVVCLLFAEHLPCQQHVSSHNKQQLNLATMTLQLNSMSTISTTSLSTKAPSSSSSIIHSNLNNVNAVSTTTATKPGLYIDHKMRKRKRHATRSTETLFNIGGRPDITNLFLKHIFHIYGREDGTIHENDFFLLLKHIGLDQLLITKYDNIEQQQRQIYNNVTCLDDTELMYYIKYNNNHKKHSNYHYGHHHDHHNSENCNEANAKTEEHKCSRHLKQYSNYSLNDIDVMNVCPLLLYQMAIKQEATSISSPSSSSSLKHRKSCILREPLLSALEMDEAKHLELHKDDIMYVWIYAFISVLACSILGLVGVAIIPFMDSRFYKHIIQFLVSLAVGTMTGDALLHLLPHSVAGQEERNMVLKGLVCMGGILFFYIMEHGLTMISEWRKRIAKREANRPARAKVMRDPDSSHNNSMSGDKMCKSKYSSYPYCYDEIAMDTKNDVWLHMPNRSYNDNNLSSNCNGKLESVGGAGDVEAAAAMSLLSTSQNNYAQIALNNQRIIYNEQQQPSSSSQLHLQRNQLDVTGSTELDATISMVGGDGDGDCINNSIMATAVTPNGKDISTMNDTVTVILREHDSTHHGHSHKHGHVHSPPESLSAVVWMIIMGDGLHNFTDGMAIGAAFAENMAGGFSTSLAVFCHELPHELGDFAILLKAGMSVRSAVYYNLLTGILSFIGMIFGIVFGQSPETAQWMFAAAAGLFIYIAMVDMMPEISAAHKSLEQFILQISGMGSGVAIMLLIALYEGDLMNIFSFSDIGNREH